MHTSLQVTAHLSPSRGEIRGNKTSRKKTEHLFCLLQKVQIHRKTDCITSLVHKPTCAKLYFTMLVFQVSLVYGFFCCCCCSLFCFLNSWMDNYSMCYLLWIRTTIITEKSIVINLVQVSKQLPWGSSVGKLYFYMVNPELHSSLNVTSGTQQEMFGVMCLDKTIEFAQRYLKIHCKSTRVQMRIEPGLLLSEANIKIGGE